ncbi:MAG: hypothetical protein JNM84_21490 [Planctomycetes bacterium]|nr:hypothetical protein [Planctomycetota bacterium]
MPSNRVLASVLAGVACLWAEAPLSAQQQEIIGSLVGRTAQSALAKGNCVRIDRTVVLTDFAFYLELAEPQSLVFTIHRAVREDASYVLEQSWSIPAQPAGPSWYSPTALYVPLLAGNHYLLSVSWSGTLTYSFHPAAAWPLTFGEQRYAYWSGAHPLPSALLARNEMPATYLMALTTQAPSRFDPHTRIAGAGCAPSGLSAPRLTCAEMPLLGNRNFALEVAASAVARPTWLWITPHALPSPISIDGCELYLDLRTPLIAIGPVPTQVNTVARYPIAIPYDPVIRGVEVPLQAAAYDFASGAVDLSNALFLLYR